MNNDYIVTKNFLDGNIVSSGKIYFDVVTKEQPTPYAYKRIGTMEYTHDITGEVLKITVSRDDSTVEKEVTFKDGKYTFAQVVAMVGAAFGIPAVKTVEGIVTIIFGNSIVNAGLDVIGTKKWLGRLLPIHGKGFQVIHLKARRLTLMVDKLSIKIRTETPRPIRKDSFHLHGKLIHLEGGCFTKPMALRFIQQNGIDT